MPPKPTDRPLAGATAQTSSKSANEGSAEEMASSQDLNAPKFLSYALIDQLNHVCVVAQARVRSVDEGSLLMKESLIDHASEPTQKRLSLTKAITVEQQVKSPEPEEKM